MAILSSASDVATVGAAAFAAKRGRVKRTYYPAVLLRLTVRLEDFSNEDGETSVSQAVPATSPAARAAIDARAAGQDQAVLRALGDDDLADATAARAQAAQAAAPPTGATSAPPNDAPPDDLSFKIDVVPLDAKIELNSFRIADKLQASFALQDLPIAPDIIRSLLVEAYVGTAAAADFGDPARWIPALAGTQAPTFRGYADVADMEAGDDFKICIQARSLEARLMDAKIHPLTRERKIKRTDSYRDPSGAVVRGEKVTSYLKRLIATIPEFSGALGDRIGVQIFPNFDGDQEPVLSAKLFLKALQSAQSRAQAGGQVQGAPPGGGVAPGQGDGGGTPAVPSPTPSEMSAWDVFVRASELCGLVPTYDPSIVMRDAKGDVVLRGADNILLMPPQTVKESPRDGLTIAGGPVDGFQREISIGGAGAPLRSEVRFLVWGDNLKRMKTSRKFGRVKAPAVRVVSFNPDAPANQRVMVAQFPTTPIGSGAVSASGTGRGRPGKGHLPTQEVITKVVRSIRDPAMLKQIAVSMYHAIARHEVSVQIETDELSSYIDPTRPESHNENPDLLRLRPGTPCRVMVARKIVDPASSASSTATDTLSSLFERRSNPAFLRKALFDSATARGVLSARGKEKLEDALRKIEQAYQTARLTDWFFCRVVNIDWSVEDGISLSMEMANFVEARGLTNLSAQDKKDNDARKKVKAGAAALPDPRRQAAKDNADDFIDRVVRGGA